MELSKFKKIKMTKIMCIYPEIGGKIFAKYLQETIEMDLVLDGYFHLILKIN